MSFRSHRRPKLLIGHLPFRPVSSCHEQCPRFHDVVSRHDEIEVGELPQREVAVHHRARIGPL